MSLERRFTITSARVLMLFWVAILAGLSVASASTTATRSATLQESGGTSVHHYDGQTTSSSTKLPAEKRTAQHHSSVLWLFDVTIYLNHDYDNDGYYSNFSITFDFDTHLSSTFVYAVLFVSNDNGPWIEYAVTDNFAVGGVNDSYTIHATLDSGYQTGYYDHYIEIYDAYTHQYLASFGPQDSHVLHGLPFESSPHDHHRGIATSVSLSFSGAGALDAGSLALLAFCLYVVLRRGRTNQQVC